MNRKNVLILLTLLLCLVGVTFADDQEMDAAQQLTPEQQAAMEAMQKAATPGEHHKHLDALAGNWTYKIKMWMEPGQPPTESDGMRFRSTFEGSFHPGAMSSLLGCSKGPAPAARRRTPG